MSPAFNLLLTEDSPSITQLAIHQSDTKASGGIGYSSNIRDTLKHRKAHTAQ